MNKIDALKKLRMNDELRYVDSDQIEQLGRSILDCLVCWSNNEIFSKNGAELSIDIPLGLPNAGVTYLSDDPLRPHMIVRQSMIIETYRDAAIFPLFCGKFVTRSDALSDLHQIPTWKGKSFLFSTGIPEVTDDLVGAKLRNFCAETVALLQKNRNSDVDANEVRCGLVMFEVMLVWIFFHELGHVLQRHYKLKPSMSGKDSVEAFLECTGHLALDSCADAEGNASPSTDLAAQARELMADAEAIDLTVKYFLATGRFKLPSIYLIFCAVSCLYQRFYEHYDENLCITNQNHPHPAVRGDVSESFLGNIACNLLVTTGQLADRSSAVRLVAYLITRSSFFTGYFRAHRIEQRDDTSELPSYIQLQTQEYATSMHAYHDVLMPHIEAQISEVSRWHLLPGHALDEWLEMLRVHQRSR